ncbi:MAG: radical SAM family heme chaperone HemW [Phycisphaerae bacterium]|nr:radical SAM family heme chaperone HemW [Phycisphaerae bacterium]
MSDVIQESAHPEKESIGWYIHLPFCRTKCGYCDFYSIPTIEHLISDLVGAIKTEMAARDPVRPVESIFVGGGTPTELPGDALGELLSAIRARAGQPEEWTVEANPSSVTELKLDTLLARGVNRISFGAQSFHPDDLRVLERLHDPTQIGESVRAARESGFANINLDLIYGIPGQSVGRWRDTLRRAIDLDAEHLSCYDLMYEEGTALTRQLRAGRLRPADESLEADMFALTIDELSASGFAQYEISNFAKPGRECRSNVIYWENREYLGVGPSAVSYLDGRRRKNAADVRRYCDWAGAFRAGSADDEAIVIESESLSPRARACETAVQMLRLTRGIDIAAFRRRSGMDPLVLFAEPIKQFAAMGLLIADAKSIRLTRQGLFVANRIMLEFLLPEEGEWPEGKHRGAITDLPNARFGSRISLPILGG